MKFAKARRNTILLTLLTAFLGTHVEAAESIERLPPNPSVVSLIWYEGSNTMTEQFGHIELRFSYGSKPDLFKDRAVGFGPPTSEDQKISPLSYIGVGPKLGMIYWNSPFLKAYESYALQKMSRVHSLALDLDASERARVVAMLNEIFDKGYTQGHYNMILENCATVVAKILIEAGNLPGGIGSFIPAKLARTLSKRATDSEVLPSGQDLKKAVFEKYEGLQSRLMASAMDREVFEMQMLSMQTEFRILAYQKLESPEAAPLFDALLKTESSVRRKFIKDRLGRKPIVSAEKTFSIANNEKLRRVVVKNGNLEVHSDITNVENFLRSRSPVLRERRVIRSWKLSELGLQTSPSGSWETGAVTQKTGSQKTLRLWIAEDLALDPK